MAHVNYIRMDAKIIDELYYYDRPLLSIESANGGTVKMLTMFCDYDENKQGHCIAVVVSNRRIKNIKNGTTTLREAFRFPEKFGVFKYAECYEKDDPDVHEILHEVDFAEIEEFVSEPGTRLFGFTHAQRRKQARRKPRVFWQKPPPPKYAGRRGSIYGKSAKRRRKILSEQLVEGIRRLANGI